MWYQLQIEQCPFDEIDKLSETLEETGALSITYLDKYDNPVLEPAPGTTPLWPEVIIQALFHTKEEAEHAQLTLSTHSFPLFFFIEPIADTDWERNCINDFNPQCFGKRLWICPSWAEPPEPDAANLILDPGLAFGTGTHPTTSLCLTWLDSAELANKTVIDFGCGSGILALAAIKLGAQFAQAVDIDEQALISTKNNADNNEIQESQLQIGYPPILEKPVDLIMANILLTPLLELQTQFKSLLKKNGTLVISGILDEQVSTLISAYAAEFIHESTHQSEGWSLIVFKAKA